MFCFFSAVWGLLVVTISFSARRTVSVCLFPGPGNENNNFYIHVFGRLSGAEYLGSADLSNQRSLVQDLRARKVARARGQALCGRVLREDGALLVHRHADLQAASLRLLFRRRKKAPLPNGAFFSSPGKVRAFVSGSKVCCRCLGGSFG